MIKLNNNWRLVTDDTNNVILQFHQIRTRKNKETKEETEYEFTEDYFYPTVATALKRWLQEDIKESKTVEEILHRIDQVEEIIKKIK